MNIVEKITLIIAAISAIFALCSLIVSIISLTKTSGFNKNTLDKSEIQNMISMGNLELSVSERIANSREKVGDIAMIMSPLLAKKETSSLTPDETLTLKSQELVLKSAIENNINAYEDACSKYLDGKIDKVRFKKTYTAEIRQLVENIRMQEYFNPVTSKFKAILKVYQEWNDLEK